MLVYTYSEMLLLYPDVSVYYAGINLGRDFERIALFFANQTHISIC